MPQSYGLNRTDQRVESKFHVTGRRRYRMNRLRGMLNETAEGKNFNPHYKAGL